MDRKADEHFYANVGIKRATNVFDYNVLMKFQMWLMGTQTEIAEELNGNRANMEY